MEILLFLGMGARESILFYYRGWGGGGSRHLPLVYSLRLGQSGLLHELAQSAQLALLLLAWWGLLVPWGM